MSRAETILVTGGAGFIGSHLFEALLAAGRQVVVFDNFNDFYDPALKRANVAALRRSARAAGGGLRVLKGDLRSSADLERALAALPSAGAAAVVHLAAMAGVRPSIEQPRLYHAVNVDRHPQSARSLPRRRRPAAGLRFLLFGLRQQRQGPLRRERSGRSPRSPPTPRPRRRGSCSATTTTTFTDFRWPACASSPSTARASVPDLAIHKFARLMAADRPLPFFGDGTTRRDYTYISDTLQGVLGALAWLEGPNGPRYASSTWASRGRFHWSGWSSCWGRRWGGCPGSSACRCSRGMSCAPMPISTRAAGRSAMHRRSASRRGFGASSTGSGAGRGTGN